MSSSVNVIINRLYLCLLQSGIIVINGSLIVDGSEDVVV